jgi:hypothetical protein
MAILTKNHAQLTAEVNRHIASDSVKQNSYKTCFIGCLARHQDDPQYIEDTYGIPVMLTRILETIFEGVPAQEAVEFFAAFPAAVAKDGKDLTKVIWKFLVEVLKKLPQQPQEIQEVIDPVIAGLSLLAEGKEWNKDDALAASNGAENASSHSWAVQAAYWAALSAACGLGEDGSNLTVANAQWAAGDVVSQKELILRIIKDA